MFDVEVTDEVIGCAGRLVAAHDFGRRGTADGNQEQQATGLIGQILLHDLFGVARPDGASGRTAG
jgi:hypothetical protein